MFNKIKNHTLYVTDIRVTDSNWGFKKVFSLGLLNLGTG